MRSAWLLSLVLISSCGWDPGASREAARPEAEPRSEASDLDPGDPTRLRTPFTADQIRGEWVEGLQLTVDLDGPEGPSLQRWTVVAADADGVDIAYEVLDPSGDVSGQPVVQRSSWTELRDHASFPVAQASRQRVQRETALGSLRGWLYTVEDAQTGTVTELFFADDLPGAPVEMATRQDGEVVSRFRQVGRRLLPPAP